MSDEIEQLRLVLEQTRQELREAQRHAAQLDHQLAKYEAQPSPRTIASIYGHAFDDLLEGCQIIGFDWRYLYINDMAARYGRHQKADLIGYTMLERYPGIENSELFAILRRCMTERRAQDAQLRFTYPDGSHAWFDFRVQPITEGIFILTQDITERKHAEETLQDREAWLVMSMDASGLGKWQHNIKTGLVRFDDRAQQHYDFSSNVVTMEQVVARIHPNDIERLQTEISTATRPESDGRFSTEYRVIHDDHSVHWLAIQTRVIFEGEGDQRESVLGFGTTQDITARKLADEQIRKLHRTLAVLSDINQAIVRIRDVQTLFQTACEIAVNKGGFLGAWIAEIAPNGKRLVPAAFVGISLESLKAYSVDLSNLTQQNPFTIAVHSRNHIIINNIGRDSSAPTDWNREQLQTGCHATAVFPLIVSGDVRGIVVLCSAETEFFDDEEVKLLDELAGDISFAMEFAEQETRRRQSETAIQRYAQRLEVLHHIDLGLLQGKSIETLIDTTLKQVRNLIACDRAGVVLIDDATHEAVFVSGDLVGSAEIPKGTRAPLPPDNWLVFDQKGLCVIDDIRTLPDLPEIYRWALNDGQAAALHVLLKNDEKPFGAFSLYSHHPGFFTPEYQIVALEIGNQLAVVLRQKQMAEEIERYTVELETHVRNRTAELHAAKEQVEAILDNSLNGIVFLDSNLQIVRINSVFKSLLGYQLPLTADLSLVDIIHEDDRARFREVLRNLPNEQGGQYIEVMMNRVGHDPLEAEIGVRSVSGGGYVCTIHDISARRKTEAALREALETEKQVNVLKSRFVSMASHEFRTPLAGILASSETLSAYRHKMKDGDIDLRLDNIRRQVQYMTGIMEDVLQLGRLQSGRYEFEPKEIDLDDLCQEILAEINRHDESAARIRYECPITPIRAQIDLRLMRQAFTNLISNALKYTPLEKSIKIQLRRDSNLIIFQITDEGIGIPESDLTNLFEPFHRASNVGAVSGTGLGLSITKRAVEQHGGTISVETEMGLGTTFKIVFPAR